MTVTEPGGARVGVVPRPAEVIQPVEAGMVADQSRTAVDWPAALTAGGACEQQALRELHGLMLRASRHQVRRMHGLITDLGPDRCDEIAQTAADEALTVLLTKLHTFEGRSRFTTWAYKFAILQAATEVRRQAWAGREVSLDGTATWTEPGDGPEGEAVASDLAGAVVRAMELALTGYQRKIAVALLIDLVPIDVLAERLGTTRGALYKTLHLARTRIRAYLRAAGYLDDGGNS
ncbi:MAG TPA: sigma-70 family RNA polymerase sigma factor [Actinomycetales bacterium]|nr:sigma-70 family RNA polymerase sigma factor [Actinomycetales bacterium]